MLLLFTVVHRCSQRGCMGANAWNWRDSKFSTKHSLDFSCLRSAFAAIWLWGWSATVRSSTEAFLYVHLLTNLDLDFTDGFMLLNSQSFSPSCKYPHKYLHGSNQWYHTSTTTTNDTTSTSVHKPDWRKCTVWLPIQLVLVWLMWPRQSCHLSVWVLIAP